MLRLAILELPAVYDAAPRTASEIDARLRAGPRADLVLLPEAALHGYVSPAGDFDLARFAEPLDGPTAAMCAALARSHAIHLVAPLVLAEARGTYNAMACFDPRGDVAFVYRKRHPWMPEHWATPGDAPPPVVAIAGATVTIGVCYDVHFLADDARAELAAADLLLFPSAWVERPDRRAERLVDIAREFDIAIANANWAPGAVRVPGQGGSCMIDRRGTIVARAPLAGRIDYELTPRG